MVPKEFGAREIWAPRNLGLVKFGPGEIWSLHETHHFIFMPKPIFAGPKILGGQISWGPNFLGTNFLGDQISRGSIFLFSWGLKKSGSKWHRVPLQISLWEHFCSCICPLWYLWSKRKGFNQLWNSTRKQEKNVFLFAAFPWDFQNPLKSPSKCETHSFSSLTRSSIQSIWK